MTTLGFWRSVFAATIHASARFPRLVPMSVVEWVDERFYRACMAETLDLAARDYRAATADTLPAPAGSWECLAGEGPELDADAGDEHGELVDLHGEDVWPHSGDGRKGWVA